MGIDIDCDYESSKMCPGVVYDEDTFQECPEGLLWNGEECVGLDECMCISDDYNHPSGSVWKEDSGCTNCICIDGQAKCTKEVCDDVICEVCVCTESGSVCTAVECPVTTLVCADDEELVSTGTSGCCPTYECKAKGTITYVYICAAVKDCPAGHTVSDVVD